jgi:hypothetical protein
MNHSELISIGPVFFKASGQVVISAGKYSRNSSVCKCEKGCTRRRTAKCLETQGLVLKIEAMNRNGCQTELTEDEFLRLWNELVKEWKVRAAEDLLQSLLLRQPVATNQ